MDRREAPENCLEMSNETERAGGRGEVSVRSFISLPVE